MRTWASGQRISSTQKTWGSIGEKSQRERRPFFLLFMEVYHKKQGNKKTVEMYGA